MYKLFTDKAELFECDIKIEGASLSNSAARLVVETSDYSLMFNGKISSDGKCKVPIKKLKGLIEPLRRAKIETIKYYRDVEPKSYSVVYGTDLINDYIKDIQTLLKKD